MRAWICEQPTGLDALRWGERPDPVPGAGEVLVEIAAASVNYPDLLIVQGRYQHRPEPPFVPGAEFAGVVRAVGAGVTTLTPGQPVACLAGTGAFATHAVVPAHLCLPLPPGFALQDAAAFIMTYATAHHALLDRGALRPGETVLVLGAAGGVGTAAIQVAKAAGARVVAAASSAAKCALAQRLGADAVLDYSVHTPDGTLRDELRRLTDGRGPDVVFDPVGGALTEPVLRSIAWRGRLLVIGFAGGAIPSLPLNLPLLKGASIVGVFWGEFARREPAANAALLQALVQGYLQGHYRPVIDTVLPMAALPEALRRLEARRVLGKLVLRNDD
ncbi:Phthiocerol/phenolphthiocerol synthesis polyketide synthase type I PpsC [Tepidimonas sediminis]|uniref:Phthiocerol/phenolphthiocerol synthesis polyketide synthase type I PpsC n=1 Tax=Tepidimonas sediminis TaxID=2588941 RepID=A0A554WJX5_9BURK|nr:NADPH:quinone oxidoreductase family protein [Tepidimonas sediminis]TSE23888.1 Phthiocerol/phenolphthiocerol synthesis polyketide synthase type I PpsC [Tepidimonas sediminis]